MGQGTTNPFPVSSASSSRPRDEVFAFFADAPGGTRVTDRVEYALPLGPLGVLAHALPVRRTLERIFTHRQERIAALLASADVASPPAPA